MDESILTEIIALINSSTALFLVPIINAILSVLKSFVSDTRWYPLYAMCLGVFGMGALNGVSVVSVFAGLLTGLMSVGLYEFFKTSVIGK